MAKPHNIFKLLLAICLMAAFMGCAATQNSESTGQYIDDSAITTKVKAAIFDDPMLKTLQISVETYKGEVQLSGFVDSALNIRRAGEVARKVRGVVAVRNNLIVK